MSDAATEQLAEGRVRELVGQYHDTYERRDKRAVADLFAGDAVISLAPGTSRGREGIRRVIDWDWKATPTIRFRPMGIDILVSGNVAVCEVMVEASYAGVRYEYPNKPTPAPLGSLERDDGCACARDSPAQST